MKVTILNPAHWVFDEENSEVVHIDKRGRFGKRVRVTNAREAHDICMMGNAEVCQRKREGRRHD